MDTQNQFNLDRLDSTWKPIFNKEFQQPYFHQLDTFVANERLGPSPIYPKTDDVFNAFIMTPFNKVRVVIIGQDPYHGPQQAHGLCFSVPHGIDLPPSLKNIFKELQTEIPGKLSGSGCLESWAKQGVLLLNTTLTVSEGRPMSHHNKGWEIFTDAIVRALCDRKEPIIFVLWGKSAQTKCIHILNEKETADRHAILTAPHPSPLSAYHGFFGCRHFSKINAILEGRGEKPIDWIV